jgi:DNA gyrase/topoisomerase IV subunit A
MNDIKIKISKTQDRVSFPELLTVMIQGNETIYIGGDVNINGVEHRFRLWLTRIDGVFVLKNNQNFDLNKKEYNHKWNNDPTYAASTKGRELIPIMVREEILNISNLEELILDQKIESLQENISKLKETIEEKKKEFFDLTNELKEKEKEFVALKLKSLNNFPEDEI